MYGYEAIFKIYCYGGGGIKVKNSGKKHFLGEY